MYREVEFMCLSLIVPNLILVANVQNEVLIVKVTLFWQVWVTSIACKINLKYYMISMRIVLELGKNGLILMTQNKNNGILLEKRKWEKSSILWK